MAAGLIRGLLFTVGCAQMSTQATTLIEYHRSGGIAGREDHVVVMSDGTAQLSRRGVTADFRIAPDTLTELRALIERVDFRAMREEYVPARRGADLYEYVVICQDRRIRLMDTAIPEELQPLMQLLGGLANRSPSP
jgi:hypothetical protein